MTLSLNQVLPGNKTDKTGIDVPPVASQEFTNVEGNAIEVLLRGLHTTGGFDFNDTNAFNSNGSPVNTEQLSKMLQDIIRTSQTWNATNVADNYIITPANTNKLPYNTALNPGLNFTTSFIVPATNVSVNLTLSINGLHTQKKLYQPDGTLFGVGNVIANALATCIYDSTLDSGNGGYRVYLIPSDLLSKAQASDVSTGTNDTKYMTPASLANSTRRTMKAQVINFLASGSYTPSSPSVKMIEVLVIGGGGGGGNATAGGAGLENGGGASGSWVSGRIQIADIATPVAVTVGAGGVIAGFGSASSFGPYITCPGGGPGLIWAGGRTIALPTVSPIVNIIGVATRGTPGEHGLNTGATGDGSGAGGGTIFGGGGPGAQSGFAGSAGLANTGGGGSGRARINNSPGAGGSGIVIVKEYE